MKYLAWPLKVAKHLEGKLQHAKDMRRGYHQDDLSRPLSAAVEYADKVLIRTQHAIDIVRGYHLDDIRNLQNFIHTHATENLQEAKDLWHKYTTDNTEEYVSTVEGLAIISMLFAILLQGSFIASIAIDSNPALRKRLVNYAAEAKDTAIAFNKEYERTIHEWLDPQRIQVATIPPPQETGFYEVGDKVYLMWEGKMMYELAAKTPELGDGISQSLPAEARSWANGDWKPVIEWLVKANYGEKIYGDKPHVTATNQKEIPPELEEPARELTVKEVRFELLYRPEISDSNLEEKLRQKG